MSLQQVLYYSRYAIKHISPVTISDVVWCNHLKGGFCYMKYGKLHVIAFGIG